MWHRNLSRRGCLVVILQLKWKPSRRGCVVLILLVGQRDRDRDLLAVEQEQGLLAVPRSAEVPRSMR